MTLAEFENDCLLELQEPAANPGSSPNWAAIQNAAFTQNIVDFYLNRAYEQVMYDTNDVEFYLFSATFPSIANTALYPIPGAGFPPIDFVRHITYAPQGQNYTLEMEPGIMLLSWKQFQDKVGWGYLTNLSFGLQPDYATITPDRLSVLFYPGSAQSGDQILVQYATYPSAGNAFVPRLVNESDVPVLPSFCDRALSLYAQYKLWIKAREKPMADSKFAEYKAEIELVKQRNTLKSSGDQISFRLRDYYFGNFGYPMNWP